MSIHKVKIEENFNIALNKLIDKGDLHRLNNKYQKYHPYEKFPLSKIKEYVSRKVICEKTFLIDNIEVNEVKIDYNQNLYENVNVKKLDFNTVKIDFTLISIDFLFHYPNEDCQYLLEHPTTNELIKIDPEYFKNDEDSIIRIA